MSKSLFDKAFAASVRRCEEKMTPKTFLQVLRKLKGAPAGSKELQARPFKARIASYDCLDYILKTLSCND